MDFVCIRAMCLKIAKVKRCNKHLFALEKTIEKIWDWQLKIESMKNEARCVCRAYFRVHIQQTIELWYVSVWKDDHSQELLEERYCAMMPSHRKLTDIETLQIDNFRRVGIRPPHILDLFASTLGDMARYITGRMIFIIKMIGKDGNKFLMQV